MTLNFEAEVNVPFDFDVEALAGEVINFTLEHEDFPYEPEVNLTLVDNEGIHAINKEFREIDRPTDVLSFPMLSYENAGDFSKLEDDYDDNFNPDTGEIMLGDIVISVDNPCLLPRENQEFQRPSSNPQTRKRKVSACHEALK